MYTKDSYIPHGGRILDAHGDAREIVDILKAVSNNSALTSLNAFDGNVIPFYKGARKTDVSNTESIVWNGTGVFTITNTQSLLNLISNNAGNAGRIIKISGVDANYNFQEETVTLAANGNAVSTKNFMRINSASNIGTTELLADVSLQNQGGTVMGLIKIGVNTISQMIFTVPVGFIALIENYSFMQDQSSEMVITNYIQNFGEVKRMRRQNDGYRTNFEYSFNNPVFCDEKSTFYMTVQGTNGKISVTTDFVLINKEYITNML